MLKYSSITWATVKISYNKKTILRFTNTFGIQLWSTGISTMAYGYLALVTLEHTVYYARIYNLTSVRKLHGFN